MHIELDHSLYRNTAPVFWDQIRCYKAHCLNMNNYINVYILRKEVVNRLLKRPHVTIYHRSAVRTARRITPSRIVVLILKHKS